MPTIEGRYLIDTNVLIYATLERDSRAERAREAIARGQHPDCEAFVSVQNLAEMYPIRVNIRFRKANCSGYGSRPSTTGLSPRPQTGSIVNWRLIRKTKCTAARSRMRELTVPPLRALYLEAV